jgi:hypothetical protein
MIRCVKDATARLGAYQGGVNTDGSRAARYGEERPGDGAVTIQRAQSDITTSPGTPPPPARAVEAAHR